MYQTYRYVFSQKVDDMFIANECINFLFLFSWFSNFFEAILESDGTSTTKLSTIFYRNMTNSYTYITFFSCFPYELVKVLATGTGFEARSTFALINMILNLGKVARFFRNVEKHAKVKALTTYDVWVNRSPRVKAFIRIMAPIHIFILTAHFWSCLLVRMFDDFTVLDPRDHMFGEHKSRRRIS